MTALDLASLSVDEIAALLREAVSANDVELAVYLEERLAGALGDREDRYFPSARPKQIPPEGDWLVWLLMAGRGFGKSLVGSEWIVEKSDKHPATYAVVSPTFGDGRDLCIEGRGDFGQPSGVLSVLERRGRKPGVDWNWNRSMGELKLANGALIKVLSADDPNRARGWNFAGAWADELGSWPYADAFDQLRFALRVGHLPQLVVTTTPRPTALIRSLVERARAGDKIEITRGATSENARNLSDYALAELERRYGGTRLGRQELEGELLDDVEGALWKRENILHADDHPKLAQIMIGVDPSTWGSDTGAEHQSVGKGIETGIVVVGASAENPVKCYVLEDLSGRVSPDDWAKIAVQAYHRWSEVAPTQIVPEVNMGQGMVTALVRLVDPSARVYSEKGRSGVQAASGKRARAEPISGMYEQHRVIHMGQFEALETQMLEWDSAMPWSPDRIDALCWAVYALKPWYAGPASSSGRQMAARKLPSGLPGRRELTSTPFGRR